MIDKYLIEIGKTLITNKDMDELREARKQWFTPMEQKLQEMHTKEDDSLFYYYSVEVVNPRIIAVSSLEGL